MTSMGLRRAAAPRCCAERASLAGSAGLASMPLRTRVLLSPTQSWPIRLLYLHFYGINHQVACSFWAGWAESESPLPAPHHGKPSSPESRGTLRGRRLICVWRRGQTTPPEGILDPSLARDRDRHIIRHRFFKRWLLWLAGRSIGLRDHASPCSSSAYYAPGHREGIWYTRPQAVLIQKSTQPLASTHR